MTAARQRRRPAELRALILDAGSKVFSSKGFSQATTEEIADAAGVSVSVFYRHFRDKAHLFQETLVQPFTTSLQQYHDTWTRSFEDAPLDDMAVMRELVTDIYNNLSAHREVVVALVTADEVLDPTASSEIRGAFNQIFAQLGAMGLEEANRRGWFQGDTIGLTSRCLFGMVASMIVYKQWLLPRGRNQISKDALIDHITKLMLYGLRLEAALEEELNGAP